jgi:hypothetical protein
MSSIGLKARLSLSMGIAGVNFLSSMGLAASVAGLIG